MTAWGRDRRRGIWIEAVPWGNAALAVLASWDGESRGVALVLGFWIVCFGAKN